MSLQTSEPVIVMMKMMKTSCRQCIYGEYREDSLLWLFPGEGGLAVHSAYDKLITPMTV